MKRIIIHWTAGGYFPTDHEKECYHFLVDRNGDIHKGKFRPEDNEICKIGRYAAHTGGGNTGSIGVAMCAMAGFVSKDKVGNYPITKPQIEACFKLCAELSIKHKIEITPQTVMTHYEFGKKNPNTKSAGKPDIIYLPPYPAEPQDGIGNFIRSKIKWYRNQLTTVSPV